MLARAQVIKDWDGVPAGKTAEQLQALVDAATARFRALSPEQQAAHREEQRRSFVRGQVGLIETDREYFRSRGLDTD
jgi:hypothetical protein